MIAIGEYIIHIIVVNLLELVCRIPV